jgi:hypothetical protein
MTMGRPGFLVDVTETLRRVGATDRLDLQFVAVPYPGRVVRARTFAIGGLELAVARLAAKPQG